MKHARQRQSVAAAMLALGDHEAAEEEYLMAATHMARALLFRSGVFPLSRAEMPSQLIEIGLTQEAEDLDRLIEGTKSLDELRDLARDIDRRFDMLAELAKTAAAKGS